MRGFVETLDNLLGPIEAEAEVLRLCVLLELREEDEALGLGLRLGGCQVVTVLLGGRPSGLLSVGLGGVFDMVGVFGALLFDGDAVDLGLACVVAVRGRALAVAILTGVGKLIGGGSSEALIVELPEGSGLSPESGLPDKVEVCCDLGSMCAAWT